MKIVSIQPGYVWVWPDAPHFIKGHPFSVEGPKRVSHWYGSEKFSTKEEAKLFIERILSEEKITKAFKDELKTIKLVKIDGISLDVKAVVKVKPRVFNVVLKNNKGYYFQKGSYLYDSDWLSVKKTSQATKFASIELAQEFIDTMNKFGKQYSKVNMFKPVKLK